LDDKVQRLQEEICKRFQGKGIKPGTLRLQNLLTSDGYELNPNGKDKQNMNE